MFMDYVKPFVKIQEENLQPKNEGIGYWEMFNINNE